MSEVVGTVAVLADERRHFEATVWTRARIDVHDFYPTKCARGQPSFATKQRLSGLPKRTKTAQVTWERFGHFRNHFRSQWRATG